MNEKRKGVLLPKQEELIAKALDFWFKFKNPIIEKSDYLIFLGMVRAGDNFGIDKMPEIWKSRLIPIVDAALDGDVQRVRGNVADFLNEKIDLPKLDDYQEMIVFENFTKFIASVVEFYVLKK